MKEFERQSPFYQSSPQYWLVRLDSIEPPRMDQRQHLDHGGFSRTRMVSILKGIATQSVLPPIELEEQDGENAYRLHSGAHRFYASVAVGFSHVPAVVLNSALVPVEPDLQVEVRGELIIVSLPGTQSYAIYTKPAGQPQLVLVSSDATKDHQLRARIWQAANDKARELGWIV
jgi:hypothetical protein